MHAVVETLVGPGLSGGGHGGFEVDEVEGGGWGLEEGKRCAPGGGMIIVAWGEMGVVGLEGADDVAFALVVIVLGEELVDEAGEHDVAGEVEGVGFGHCRGCLEGVGLRHEGGLVEEVVGSWWCCIGSYVGGS